MLLYVRLFIDYIYNKHEIQRIGLLHGEKLMDIKKKKYKTKDFILLPFQVSSMGCIFYISVKLLEGIIPVLLVLCTASFIDRTVVVFQTGSLIYSIVPLIGILICISLSWVLDVTKNLVNSHLTIRMNGKLRIAIAEKRNKMCYRYIEDNETWELIQRVGKDSTDRLIEGFTTLLDLTALSIQILGLIFIIAIQIWWAALLVMGVSIPLFILAAKSGKEDYRAYEEAAGYIRKADYLKKVLSTREAVEERFMFGFTDQLNGRWLSLFHTAKKIELRAIAWNFIRMKTAGILTISISIISAFSLLYPVASGGITLGMYISLVNGVFNLVENVSWNLTSLFREHIKHLDYLKDFSAFSALEEQEGALSLPEKNMHIEEIEFKNVFFSYPGSDIPVLNGLSMKLHKNMQYAVVGKNGAGKTTLTKLLLGLYDDYSGEILINNKELRTYTAAERKGFFSTVFQDFSRYHISIYDNIALGRAEDMEHVQVKDVLKQLDMVEKMAQMPDGLNTKLGKTDENSVDISGGQWQRIAIARSLVGGREVRILDEPTAALDPMSESKIYQLFSAITKGTMGILITHRLGAASIADKIIVINDGIVAEQGSHKELLAQNGIYTEMYEAQRSWYYE